MNIIRHLSLVCLLACFWSQLPALCVAQSGSFDETDIAPATFGRFVNEYPRTGIPKKRNGSYEFSADYKIQGVKENHRILVNIRYVEPAMRDEKQYELTNVRINWAKGMKTYVSKTRQAYVTVDLKYGPSKQPITHRDVEPLARHILAKIEARSVPWPDYVLMAKLPESIGRYQLHRWYLWDRDTSDTLSYMQYTAYYKTQYVDTSSSTKEFVIQVAYYGPDDVQSKGLTIDYLARGFSIGKAKVVHVSPTHQIAAAHSTEHLAKKREGMLSTAELQGFDQLSQDLIKRLSPLAVERLEGLDIAAQTIDARQAPDRRLTAGSGSTSSSPGSGTSASRGGSASDSDVARSGGGSSRPPSTYPPYVPSPGTSPSGSTPSSTGGDGPAVTTDQVVVVTLLTSLIIAGLGAGLSFSQAITNAIVTAIRSGLEVTGEQVVEAINRVTEPPPEIEIEPEAEVPPEEKVEPEVDAEVPPEAEVQGEPTSEDTPIEPAPPEADGEPLVPAEEPPEDGGLVPTIAAEDPPATGMPPPVPPTPPQTQPEDPVFRDAAQLQRDAGQREIDHENSWQGTVETMLDGFAHSGRDTATVLGDAWRAVTNPDNYQALVEGTVETLADITGMSNNPIVNEALTTMNPDRMSVPEKVTQGGEFLRDTVAGLGRVAGELVGSKIDADPDVVVAVDVLSTLGGKVVAPGAQTVLDPDADARLRETLTQNGEQVLTGLQRLGEMGANGATRIVEVVTGVDRFREAIDGKNDPTTRVQNALLGTIDLATTLHGVGGKFGELAERAGDFATTVRTGTRATEAIGDGSKLEDAIRAGGRTLDDGVPAAGLADDIPTTKVVPPESGGGNRVLGDSPADPTDIGNGPTGRTPDVDPVTPRSERVTPTQEPTGPAVADGPSGGGGGPPEGTRPTPGTREHYDHPLSPRHVDPQDPRYIPPGTPADEVHLPPSDWSGPVPDPIVPADPIPTQPRLPDADGIDPGGIDLGDFPPSHQPDLPDVPGRSLPDDDLVPPLRTPADPPTTQPPATQSPPTQTPTPEAPPTQAAATQPPSSTAGAAELTAEEAANLQHRRAGLEAAREHLTDADDLANVDSRIADINAKLGDRPAAPTQTPPVDVDPPPTQATPVDIDPPPAQHTAAVPDDGVYEMPIVNETADDLLAQLEGPPPPPPVAPPQPIPVTVLEEAQNALPSPNRVVQTRENGCFEAVTAGATGRPLEEMQAATSRWNQGYSTKPDAPIPANQVEGFLREAQASPRRPIAAMDEVESAYLSYSEQMRGVEEGSEQFRQLNRELSALGDREAALRQTVAQNPQQLRASLDQGNIIIGKADRPHMVSIQGYHVDADQNTWLRIIDPDPNAVNGGVEFMRLDDAVDRFHWRSAYRVG
ncbi:hypothetical protein [Bremerella sp.]|uniref:hypothetical protein n=1 Tax=Bremerella sp. TaxID=2795602 RepID=UPI00391CF927